MPSAAATSDGWLDSTWVASCMSAAVRSSLRRMHRSHRRERRPHATNTPAEGTLPSCAADAAPENHESGIAATVMYTTGRAWRQSAASQAAPIATRMSTMPTV